MKLSTYVLAVVLLSMVAPLRAQTPPDPSGATQTGTVPTRNIMPQSINHKPDTTPPPKELADAIDKFYKTLEAGNYPLAYDTFLSATRLGQQEEKKSFFISKTEDAFGIYGKLNDYELFDNYKVGSNVIVLTYLTRHPLQPLRWRFIYYRADKTWSLINMGFDDVLLDMLD